MSPLQVLVLAVAATIGLAAFRFARERVRWMPGEGKAGLLVVLALVLLPPIGIGALIAPPAAMGPLRGALSVPLYGIILAALTILMSLAAILVRSRAHRGTRSVLLIALVGSDGDAYDFAIGPPLTAGLAESVATVDRANAAFPRGVEFPAQIDRPGIRSAWDALDSATGALEGAIADDCRLGVGVASSARDTAMDARSRLNTLRRLAFEQGQAWAAN